LVRAATVLVMAAAAAFTSVSLAAGNVDISHRSVSNCTVSAPSSRAKPEPKSQSQSAEWALPRQ
jgi:hypothetical protein